MLFINQFNVACKPMNQIYDAKFIPNEAWNYIEDKS